MCARYTLTAGAEELSRRFRAPAPAGHRPRYNIAPGEDVPVLLLEEGSRRLKPLRWGLIPSWSGKSGAGKPIVNARAETLALKPSFQGPLAGRRCLVPSDGFYEWRGGSAGKAPLRFTLEEGLFSFAGLWERRVEEDGTLLETFTLVTVPANALLSPVHDRMPAILPPSAEERWLTAPGADAALPLLTSYPAAGMRSAEASRRVNTPGWDAPDCLVPDDPEPELF